MAEKRSVCCCFLPYLKHFRTKRSNKQKIQTSVEDEIKKLEAGFCADFDAGDVTGIGKNYIENARFMPGGLNAVVGPKGKYERSVCHFFTSMLSD